MSSPKPDSKSRQSLVANLMKTKKAKVKKPNFKGKFYNLTQNKIIIIGDISVTILQAYFILSKNYSENCRKSLIAARYH